MFEVFGISDIFSFSAGAVAAFVAVQVYPPSARIGVWIVNKVKEIYNEITN